MHIGKAKTAGLILIVILIEFNLPAFSQDDEVGLDNFVRNCAQCHGADAKGDGPRSAELHIKPADLTLLAKKNNVIFNPGAVYQIIDGRMPGSRAHIDVDMPIWGCRHSKTPQLRRKIPKHYRPPSMMPPAAVEKRDNGSTLESFLDLSCDSDEAIQGRLLSIIGYLSRIQTP
jgi:hypothetical protein